MKGVVRLGTRIRPEISKKNPYWLEKHRYYELKHFCQQYPEWQKIYGNINGLSAFPRDMSMGSKWKNISNPTERIAIMRTYYIDRMNMVKVTAEKTDPILAKYISFGVINGWSYDVLKARLNIPCCKDIYYEMYRKFFWLLDKERE